MMGKKGDLREHGWGLKIVTALAGLLFLLATAAMAPALPLDSNSSGYAVTEVNPPLMGEWVKKAPTPKAGGYGEAMVGTGKEICIARCYNINDNPAFWRYDPENNSWDSMNTLGLERGAFRNGAALAWDSDDYIYALLGARYPPEDVNRCLFYRYCISNNSWEQRADTPHAQGAGDAITWANGSIYAMVGSRKHETAFACYNCSNNSWKALTMPLNWKNKTDDDASLVWTGGEYLYALQGEVKEKNPNNTSSIYHIPTKRWEEMNPIPETGGVGDGASLLWIGSWLTEYSDYIFALGGGSCLEDPGYNFYKYNILAPCDNWEQLESIPCPIGCYNGNRLGFVNRHIYYWQGTPCGNAFYMLNLLPIASFTYSPELPYVDQKIIFDASSSYDPDGFIKEYKWDFGDGTNGNGKIVNHSYSKPGDYIVTLTVVDDNNAANTTDKTIDPLSIFDTGQPQNPYPSIFGTHNGTITPNQTMNVSKLYTYPCVGTDGHTEYARIWNSTLEETARWDGYKGDWHNVSFSEPFTLLPNKTYNYTIKTGSYPQIHHTPALPTANGWINCTEFGDANGKIYYDWIPAIKLYF